MNLLPANLASLADVCERQSYRYGGTMGGIHLTFQPDNTYRAEATNGKVLLRVTAPSPADATEYPSFPALSSAPNGATEAVIPVADWQRAFKSLPKARAVKNNSILANVAVVCSDKEVSLGTTDLSQASAVRTANLLSDSRYPDTDNVIPNTPPVASVNLDALRLSDLLRTMKPLTDCCNGYRVTLEFHGTNKPAVIRATNPEGQQTVALIMPLT